jgi:hypothetical protein
VNTATYLYLRPFFFLTARNKVNAGKNDKSVDEVCALILKHLTEFSVEKLQQPVVVSLIEKPFSKPPEGAVKLILVQHSMTALELVLGVSLLELTREKPLGLERETEAPEV